MKLVSASGAVVAERVEEARSVKERLVGLLGRARLDEGTALLIDPCTSIHTFFMRFPIDVLFVSRDLRVVRAIQRMKPWRATRIYPSAAFVLELPAGALERTPVIEGETVAIV